MQPAHNKYAYRSRVSENKFRHLVKCFALDTDATRAAVHSGLSRVTVNRYYMAFRNAIFLSLDRSRIEGGVVELDESYFGARRIRGKRGRGAGGKTIVFGIFERGEKNKVRLDIVKDVTKNSLVPVISERIAKKTVVYTDGYPTYDCLSSLGYGKHFRVNHGADVFSRGKIHVNGIESFWAFAKRRLSKFCGVPKRFFELHLSECEFRFNLGSWENIYKALLQMFFKAPLFAVSRPKKFRPGNPMTFSRFSKMMKSMKVMNITKKRRIFSRFFSRLLLFCIFLL
jgi:transposase